MLSKGPTITQAPIGLTFVEFIAKSISEGRYHILFPILNWFNIYEILDLKKARCQSQQKNKINGYKSE